MRRVCRERFSRHRLQRKSLVSDTGIHHGTCVTHVSWGMSGTLTRGAGRNVPGIPGACATRNFMYLARSPWGPFCRHCCTILKSITHCCRFSPPAMHANAVDATKTNIRDIVTTSKSLTCIERVRVLPITHGTPNVIIPVAICSICWPLKSPITNCLECAMVYFQHYGCWCWNVLGHVDPYHG